MDPGRPSGSLPHPPEWVAAAVTPAVARTGRRAAGGFLAALALLAAALAAAPAPAWAQTVSLGLSSTSISEGGGVATVTASLTSAASAAVTVTVSVTPVASTGARAGDYTLTGTTLTIAASATASTGTVTITAVNNDIDAPDKRVRVKGSATGGSSLTGPADVTLTIADNEPSVSATTWRNGAPTAATWDITTSSLLAKTTAQPLAVTSRPNTRADFWACATRTVAQQTQGYTSTGPNTSICTKLTDSSTPTSITLTQRMIDNDGVVIVLVQELSGQRPYFYLYAEWVPIVALPKATLTLSSSSIPENGGVATVTATLDKPASGAATVTVAASPGAGTDFTLSATTALVFADGATASTGTVTITAMDDNADAPNAQVTISGTIGGDIRPPDPTTLTLIDNEGTPMLALALSPSSISETGGVATVTATLSGASSAPVTVTVQAVPGTGATARDFTLSLARTLTIAANATTSTGTVTITAVNNDMRTASKQVTVSGSAAGGGVANPASVTLTVTDNDGTLPTGSDRRWGQGWRGWNVTTASLLGKTAPQTIAMTAPSLENASQRQIWACARRTVSPGAGSTHPAPTEGATCSQATGSGWSRTIRLTQAMIDNDGVTVFVTNTARGRDNVTNFFYGEWLPITALPKAALALTSSAISETGGVATVTATLDEAALSAATVTVTVTPGAGAMASDVTLSATPELAFAAGATVSTGTVTITAVGNDTDSPDKRMLVSGQAAGDVRAPAAVALTLTDDDDLPTLTLALSQTSISENGGVTSVTATLSGASSEEVVVTVTAADDFSLSGGGTLTIAAGATTSGAVTLTANDNDTDAPDKEVTVSATAAGGNGVASPTGVALTLTDDETLPTVALSLSPSSISETGGVASVTATLSGKSSEAVTVTVGAEAGTGAVAADFGLSAEKTLTIAAGATASSGDVTITANGNDVDSPDKSVTVSGTVAGGNNVAAPSNVTLTLSDDETLPTVALALSPSSISETGGVASVTATLSGKSSEAVTVTVGAEAGTGAVAADFGLSAAKTLTIAAGATASSGDVTITANGNDVDSPDKSVTVSGTATGGNNVAAPSNVTLTLTDDDALPTVALALSPTSISETGGVASVTATLSGKSSEAVTVTVDAAAGTGAVAADFGLSAEKTLTIAAGATASSGDVTITANGNDVDSPDKSVTVSGTVAGGNNVAAPSNVTLTLSDDETLPTVALALSPSSISETGGVASVTATLSGKSSEAVTVTVGAEAGTGAVAADFGLSAEKTLTIAAGATASSGDVTITANGNDVDSPDKSVTVSGTVAGGNNVAAPSNLTLTLSDDETLPTLTLALSSSSVSETGGKTTVTATLSGKSSEALTVTVGAAAGTGAVAADFTLSTAKTLTFAVGATTSAGTVTVTANGNLVDTNDKSVTVSGTVAGGNNVAAPSNLTLTLTDDDTAGVTFNPTTLTLTEEGSGKKFTVVLDTEPPPGTTWVGIYPDIGLELEGSHSFPRGINYAFTPADWNTAQTVSVNALADADHQDNTLRLRYVVAGYGLGNVGQGVAHAQRPVAVTVTVEDDDKPVVTLALSSSSISETGGVATVTATLDKVASEGTTVTVEAAAGTGAAAADFGLSAAKTLTIAAGSTASAGTVTVTANGNDVHSGNKSVTVSATVDGGDGASDPDDVTLTLADDETLPTVTLALSSSSISETGGKTTVTATLSGKSSEAVTVTVGASPGTGAVAADFDLSATKTLTIAAGNTTSAGTVTVTANGNDVYSGNKSVTVSGTATGGNNVAAPSDVTLTLTDDETQPTVTLLLSDPVSGQSDTIKELATAPPAERMTTVTATLGIPASAAVTITVSATAGTNAVAGNFTLSTAKTLTIAAGVTTSTGTVTITAVDDRIDSIVDDTVAGKKVVVKGAPSGTLALTAPADVELLIWEDDRAALVTAPAFPRCRRAPCPVWLSVAEGASDTFTVKLNSEPTTNIAVAVKSDESDEGLVSSGTGAAAASTRLTFTATNWETAQTVTLHGVVDNVVDGDDDYTLRLFPDTPDTPTDAYHVIGGASVRPQTVRTTDVDVAGLTVSESTLTVTEGGTEQTFTVKLTSKPAAAVTVTATSADGDEVRLARNAGDADARAFAASKVLVFTANDWNDTQTLRVAAVDDDRDDPASLSVAITLDTASGGDSHYNGLDDETVDVTKNDDDATPTLALALSPSAVSESSGVATVTATLSGGKSGEAVTVTVAASPGTGAVAADFDLSTAKTLTIAAGSTASAGTVTVTANPNNVDSPDKQVTISGTVAGGHGLLSSPSNVTLTLTDDETLPTVTLALSSASIPENGGVATVTAKLSGKSSEAVTVTVAASPGTGAVAADFALSTAKTLTIAAGTTTSAGAVTVTANDNMVSSAHKQVTVSGTVTGGNGVAAPSNVTLTLTDDDAPQVTLLLSATGIDESGASNVATVTAALSAVANEATTVTVSASPGAGTDFTLAGTKLTIAVGDTTSTGVVTITATDNTTDAPDKQVTVSATVVGGDGAVAPSDVTLTIADDEAAPGVALSLSAASIAENGGETTVSATLSHPSSAATTVTVTAAAGLYTVASGTGATIVIAAGETVNAADTATVTAVDDDVHQGAGGRSTPVTATVANDQGAGSVSGATLALTDDEALPTLTLALSSSSVSETGGETTVTATLSGKSSEAVTVTVAVSPGTGAVAADFALSTAKTLTIAVGATISAGTVTVTANGNDVDSPDKQVTVSGTVTGGNGVATPSSLTLTLTDDETLPTVTLALSSSSISETGGETTVTATLSGKSSEAVVVTVGAVAGTGAVAADFALSTAKTLTIAVGATISAGTVTVTANGNDVDAPDKQVTVSGTVTGGNGVAAPSSLTLTLTDDETLPTVTLALSPASITESGGVSSVTATLSGKSSQAVTVTVAAAAGTGAVAADFALSAAKTLTIAAGSTTSAGAVTVTANGNPVDSPNKSVTVSGTVTGGNGVAVPSNVTLTLSDDDALPTATLLLSAASIDESGASNVTTVTARLDHGSSEAVTVTVSLSPVSSTGAVAGDYTLSSTNTLTIAAGATASSGLVTVTAVGNDVDAPNREVTVSGNATGGRGVADPAGKTLTIRDDDGAPGVTLSLNPATVDESGAGNTSVVSAALSHPSSAATTVTVTAVAGAFTVPSGAAGAIVIAAGDTTAASDTVTITAVDNDVDAPDNEATVTATVANDQGAGSVTGATLTLTDDEATPTVTLSVMPGSISENGATAMVSATLSGRSSKPTTVTVTAQANVFTVPSGAAGWIVIAAGATTAAGDTVTITAVDNDVDAADNPVTVAATAGNGHGVGAVTGASLTLTDDDTAGVAVSPATSASSRLQTTEAGGTDTFTVALESEPTGDVELDLASSDTTEGAVSSSSLTFTSTNWNMAQTVTLTGQDDAATDGNVNYTVTLTVDQANTADAVYDALSVVTVHAVNADDEYGLVVGTVTGQATEAGGTASFTVALRTQPAQAVTVAVTSRDSSEGRVSPSTLTFQPGSWSTTQAVTVTGLDDNVDDGAVTWQVRLDPASGDGNYNALANVDVSVTTTDDDGPPAVTLSLSPSSIDESGTANTAAVRATLSRASSAATTVTVTAVTGFYTVGADATIVIPAGDTAAASDTAAITAVDNATDAPDRTGPVTATVANDRAAADGETVAVTGELTVRDDDDPPNVTLSLNPASVAENGGTSAVSATLSHRSSAATTVTVTAAVSGFYTVGSDATIVIPAGDTTAASDTATVAAEDNDVDEPNRTETVTATAANGQGAGSVTGATLTLTDDEATPTVALSVSPASISENRETATVRATLSGRSSEATTVTVTAQAGVFTVASGAGGTIVIAAGQTTTTDTATITAVDNDVDAADNAPTVTVTGTAANGHGVTAAATGAELTITDDDVAGIVTSPVTSATSRVRTSEDGSTATVDVTLATRPTGDVRIDVASSDTAQGTVSPAMLTFTSTPTNWETAQTVTLTGVNDSPGAADGSQTYTVSLTVDTANTADAIYDAVSAVTIHAVNADDELGLDVGTVMGQATEAGGTATFTVRLVADPALATQASQSVTVSVTSRDASEGRVSPPSLTFTAGASGTWNVNQTVTVTGVDDAIDDGDVAWDVRLDTSSAAGSDYAAVPDVDVSVTTTDNDATPSVTLSVSPGTIAEDGGTATVRAVLSRASSSATTVTVTGVSGLYTPGADATIVIPAGATTSPDTATIAAEDDAIHQGAAGRAVTVTATVANDRAAADGETVAVTGAALTLTDDDEKGLVFGGHQVVFDQEVVTVAEGGTTAYTVKLKSQPTGNVAVTVTSDNADVTISSSTPLTFTTSNWNEAQAVTVMAASASADGDDYAEAAVVSHSASGGGYDGEARTVEVAVSGDTEVEVRDVAGTRRYRIEDRWVAVTVEAGVPDRIEADLTGVGSGPLLTLTFAPPSASVALESGRYSLGPAGSRTVVDLAVNQMVSLEVCLPVSEGLRTARAAVPGRVLVLLHHDGSTWEVSDSDPTLSPDGTMLCGSAGVFSPFAVGYADDRPKFEFTDVADMVFTVDEAIVPVTLPAAAGGDFPMGEMLGLSTLTPQDLPPGLDFDPDGSGRCGERTLCGTPTEEFAQRRYTWTTGEDADGQIDVLPFTIEVVPARAQARARLKELNASVLPEVARASWDSWAEAVAGRLASSSRGGGGSGAAGEGLAVALAGFVQANEQALEEGGVSWKELLSGRSFAVALGGRGEGEGADPGRLITVWGAGDRRGLSREVPSLKWSGDLFAAHLGADVELGPGVRGGVGVSWFESRVDYVDRSGDDGPVEGEHRTRMASVQPYMGWSLEGGGRLWGSVGYGSGEVEIVDKALVERFGRQKSDSRFAAVAAGGSVQLTSGGATRVDLKGEGQVTRYAVDDNGDLIAGLSVKTQRVRVSAQGTREYVLAGGGRLLPSGELGIRWDGGDGATGAGVEVGAGMSWVGSGRTELEVEGRWLAAHRSDLEEWGLSGGVRVEPDADGRGLSLSVEPGWGEVGSGTSRLWEEGMAGRGETAQARSGAVLEAELGYGVGAFGGFGVATPYTRLGRSRDERRYGVGWRLSRWPEGAFELDLEGWRREREAARAEHGADLKLHLRW